MFILKLFDRNGSELKEGDIVKISDGHNFTFFAEVKWLEKEQVIAPFHTFSFSSFIKVDSLPEGVTKSTEERYGIWWIEEKEEDITGEDFRNYLLQWRQIEYHLEDRCYRIEKIKSNSQTKLF